MEVLLSDNSITSSSHVLSFSSMHLTSPTWLVSPMSLSLTKVPSLTPHLQP